MLSRLSLRTSVIAEVIASACLVGTPCDSSFLTRARVSTRKARRPLVLTSCEMLRAAVGPGHCWWCRSRPRLHAAAAAIYSPHATRRTGRRRGRGRGGGEPVGGDRGLGYKEEAEEGSGGSAWFPGGSRCGGIGGGGGAGGGANLGKG
uniref:Uncharacterized protein n=1 Tax=Arundo donax TaxID=35708 RepID=A0A0A9D4X4_ARUDO